MKGTTSFTHHPADLFTLGSKVLDKHLRVQVERLEEFMDVVVGCIADGEKESLAEIEDTWRAYKILPMSHLLVESGDSLAVQIVKNMCRQKIMYQYDPAWIDLFLEANRRILLRQRFETA